MDALKFKKSLETWFEQEVPLAPNILAILHRENNISECWFALIQTANSYHSLKQKIQNTPGITTQAQLMHEALRGQQLIVAIVQIAVGNKSVNACTNTPTLMEF